MGNRPAVDHHQPHLHLAVARLPIATVSKVGQIRWPTSLKIGARQVVEDHLGLQVEQIDQSPHPAHRFGIIGARVIVFEHHQLVALYTGIARKFGTRCGGISLQTCRRTLSLDAVGLVFLFFTSAEWQS